MKLDLAHTEFKDDIPGGWRRGRVVTTAHEEECHMEGFRELSFLFHEQIEAGSRLEDLHGVVVSRGELQAWRRGVERRKEAELARRGQLVRGVSGQLLAAHGRLWVVGARRELRARRCGSRRRGSVRFARTDPAGVRRTGPTQAARRLAMGRAGPWVSRRCRGRPDLTVAGKNSVEGRDCRGEREMGERNTNSYGFFF